ncbi:unnamed protein product, partial [Didymodactylos carnosus]
SRTNNGYSNVLELNDNGSDSDDHAELELQQEHQEPFSFLSKTSVIKSAKRRKVTLEKNGSKRPRTTFENDSDADKNEDQHLDLQLMVYYLKQLSQNHVNLEKQLKQIITNQKRDQEMLKFFRKPEKNTKSIIETKGM